MQFSVKVKEVEVSVYSIIMLGVIDVANGVKGVKYQMKSVQWLQKVGCLKNRAVNWWSFTSMILLCLRAPFLWKTGSLGGGERGEGSGEEEGDGEDKAREDRDGDRETGVDMLPVGLERTGHREEDWEKDGRVKDQQED